MKKILFGTLLAAAPFVAFAQNPNQLYGIITIVKNVLNYVMPIVIVLGVIYFIWNVIKYATNKEAEKREEAREAMIYGLIGLFVIVSIWGIIGFIGSTLGVGQGGSGLVPCVNDADNNPYNGCQ